MPFPRQSLFRLADVHPDAARHPLQIGQGDFHRVVGRARGRIHRVETLQAGIQIHGHAIGQRKGADPAHGMAHQRFHLLSPDEMGLL